MVENAPRPAFVWGALLTLYLAWGSTYLAIAVAVDTLPPFLMAAIRFATAGLVLLGWSFLRERRSLVLPTRREWRDSAIVGAFLLGGGMGLVSFGEQTVPSGIAALLVAMMPVWIVILGWIVLRERTPAVAVAGIVVGFAGVAFLVGPTVFGGDGALDPLGLAALIVSPVLWAAGSLFASHRARLPARPLVATAVQMLTGSVVLALMAIVTGEPGRLRVDAVSTASLAGLAYLTAVGSLVAFTAYGWLLRVAPLQWVTTYAYVNPVVAVGLGALILREPIDGRQLAAGAIIIAAVALIVTTRGWMVGPRSRPVAATEPVRAA